MPKASATDEIRFACLSPRHVPTAEELLDLSILMTQLSERERSVGRDQLVRAIKSPQGRIAVARTTDGRIVGVARLSVDIGFGGDAGLIEEVVVHDQFQCRGLARGLMKCLIDEAHRLHLRKLFLTSRKTRQAAHRLYIALGFIPRESTPFVLVL